MNTTAKSKRHCQDIVLRAKAKGLEASTVPMSGHLGRRAGGRPFDVDVAGWRVEAKRYKGGIGSKEVEGILLSDQGVNAVAHQADRGISLVTMGLEDWLKCAQNDAAVAAREA